METKRKNYNRLAPEFNRKQVKNNRWGLTEDGREMDLLNFVDAPLIKGGRLLDKKMPIIEEEKDLSDWNLNTWGNTHDIDDVVQGSFPINGGGIFGDRPVSMRVNLLPRILFVARAAAKSKNLDLEQVLQQACYAAIRDMGVVFESEVEHAALNRLAEKGIEENSHLQWLRVYTVADVYHDEEIGADNALPQVVPLVETPSEKNLDKELDNIATAIAKLRAMKQYESIYSGVPRKSKQEIREELDFVLSKLPSYVFNGCPQIMMYGADELIQIAKSYYHTCEEELRVLLTLNKQPFKAGYRAALLSRAAAAASVNRKQLARKQLGLPELPALWQVFAGDLVSEARAASLFRTVPLSDIDVEMEGQLCALDLAFMPAVPEIRAKFLRVMGDRSKCCDRKMMQRHGYKEYRPYFDEQGFLRGSIIPKQLDTTTHVWQKISPRVLTGKLAWEPEWVYADVQPFTSSQTNPFNARSRADTGVVVKCS